MHTLSHNVLGTDIQFRSDADPVRVEKACALLEEKYKRIVEKGRILSREKLLTLIALSIADDFLALQESQASAEKRIEKLLEGIEKLV